MSDTHTTDAEAVLDLYGALAWVDRKAYAPLTLEDQIAFRSLRRIVGDAILQGSSAALASAPPAGQGNGVQPEWRLVMRDLLREIGRNTCLHEETHRGGAIWTICNSCGRKWADDRGGFVPYSPPAAVVAAEALLASAPPAPTPDAGATQMAEGCCSAVSPCSHQQRDPATFCAKAARLTDQILGAEEPRSLAASERISVAQAIYADWMEDYDPTAPDYEVHLFDAMKAAIMAADLYRSTASPPPAEDLAGHSETAVYGIEKGGDDLPREIYREMMHVYEGFARIEEISSFAREYLASVLRLRERMSGIGTAGAAAATEAALDAEMRYDFNLPWSQFADRVGAERKRRRMRAILEAAFAAVPSPAEDLAGQGELSPSTGFVYMNDEATVLAASDTVREAALRFAEERYQMGHNDGYESGVFDVAERIDLEVEYCISHDPDQHCPGPAAMIEKIAEMFEAARVNKSQPLPSSISGPVDRLGLVLLPLLRQCTIHAATNAELESYTLQIGCPDLPTLIAMRDELESIQADPNSRGRDLGPQKAHAVSVRIRRFIRQFRQGVFGENHGTAGLIYRDEGFKNGCWFDAESKALLAVMSQGAGALAIANHAELNEVVAECFWLTDFGSDPMISWKLATIQGDERGPQSAAAEQVARFRSKAALFTDLMLARITFYEAGPHQNDQGGS